MEKDEQGVTPAFRRELNKVAELMKKRDYAGAHFHAEWMLREKVKFSYEYAVLQAQLAETLAADGRIDEALRAATGATSRTGNQIQRFRIGEPPPRNNPDNYLLPKDLVVYLLGLRMQLQGQRGDFLQDGNALLFRGKVTEEFWSHDLFHPQFTTQNVKGNLTTVHLHCRGGAKEFDFVPGEVWSLPPELQDCVVEFYGEPGATLELVEMPAG